MTTSRSESPTIRDMIREIRAEVRKGGIAPNRAAELLNTLSALYGSSLDEGLRAESEYNDVLLAALKSEEVAAKAKILAAASPQFVRMRETKNAEKECLEMSRALKNYLRNTHEEMRLS